MSIPLIKICVLFLYCPHRAETSRLVVKLATKQKSFDLYRMVKGISRVAENKHLPMTNCRVAEVFHKCSRIVASLLQNTAFLSFCFVLFCFYFVSLVRLWSNTAVITVVYGIQIANLNTKELLPTYFQ
jgi:hypothetical protein